MLFTNIAGKAQTNIEFTKENFPNDKTGLKSANQNLRIGTFHYMEGRYFVAIVYLTKAQEFNPDNADLNYKMGNCYLKTYHRYKSLDYFLDAYKLNTNVAPDIHFRLGWALQLNYEFDKAIEEYNKHKGPITWFENMSSSTLVKKRIEECEYGKQYIQTPLDIDIVNMGTSINTRYPDYRPFISANDSIMIFTSRRANTTGKQYDPNDYKYFEDIYISYFKENNWTRPRSLSTNLNTISHDAVVGMSGDGDKIIYYAGSKNNGDLYISEKKGDKWDSPMPLGENINSSYRESCASFSLTGDTLYFVSNKPEGSVGGKDIYYSIKQADNSWGPAINMGQEINTIYDEEGIMVHADGKTIYFSSVGHSSMGGYDVFSSTRDENNKWSTPKNIGYPVNTPDDDVFFALSANGKHGYFSSAREDGIGEQDIYKINFIKEKIPGMIVDTLAPEVDTTETEPPIDIIIAKTNDVIEFIDTTSIDTSNVIEEVALVDSSETIAEVIEEDIVIEDIVEVEDDPIIETTDDVPQITLTDIGPMEISIEVIDVHEDARVTTYIPDDYKEIYTFTMPANTETEVDVDMINLATRYGSAHLISSDLTQSILSRDINILRARNKTLNNSGTGSTANNTSTAYTTPSPEIDYAARENIVYTVQLKALNYPVDMSYFNNVRDIREYHCTDGYYKYVTGEVTGWRNALELRKKMVSIGYPDAFIVSLENIKSKTVPNSVVRDHHAPYTIQIMATKNKVNISHFDSLGKVKEFKGKTYYLYTYGHYKSIDEAKEGLSEVISKGVPKAFILPVKALR